ncbi:CAF17-like 4Fe-4S cluster assembly/insertion protein YgfZ [Halonotius pteroides]|uniref:Aminomethyl transferase family protein n=1 Tax=Halonotius pteroides TaxID=268735 RepID=A0A3A6PZC5_9EURY|nr:glycine cleavage T C-terminal barrel domain-containing protein [Halonotius pteroides]RJX49217.1 aminomethyl transferase family protein [Halonotius pteroides]
MTLSGAHHDDLGATYLDRGGRQLVAHYGRPRVAHRAVRNGVGVIELGYGIVSVTGDDRIEYVDNVVTNRVPPTDGRGCYAFVLDPQGKIETDCYIYNADEQLLLFTPPTQVDALVADWSEKIFVQDVAIDDVSTEFGVFGIHGPSATEKVASVLNHAGAPEPELHFDRGSMGDAGVTVAASDNPTGEDGYTIICGADDAPGVFDTLLNHGLNAAPFGEQTWETLTVEAGTPRFEAELDGVLPNTVGARHGVDFEKGCFIGQEVVSKVENRGRPSRRLIGLSLDDPCAPGDELYTDGDAVGEVTRAIDSPSLDTPIALAFCASDAIDGSFTVYSTATEGADGDDPHEDASGVAVDADRAALPVVGGSATSLRCPTY